MISPQMLHLYLALPAFRQVAATTLSLISTNWCSWASAWKWAVSTTPPALASAGMVYWMVALL